MFLRAEVTLQVQHVQSWIGTALCQKSIPIEIPKVNNVGLKIKIMIIPNQFYLGSAKDGPGLFLLNLAAAALAILKLQKVCPGRSPFWGGHETEILSPVEQACDDEIAKWFLCKLTGYASSILNEIT